MPVTTETRIRELIAEMPVSARILTNHQIDFCENSKRTLEEVCRERRIDAAVILDEIGAAASRRPEPDREWAGAPLPELLTYIVAKHHGFLRTELPWAEAMARRVREKHGDAYPFLSEVEMAVSALREELDMHLMKEEQVLFPYVASLAGGVPASSCFGTVANPIRMMEFEHDNARQALQVLRRLTANYAPPPDSCLTFRILYRSLESIDADLQVHIDLENETLHPAALRLEQRVVGAAV